MLLTDVAFPFGMARNPRKLLSLYNHRKKRGDIVVGDANAALGNLWPAYPTFADFAVGPEFGRVVGTSRSHRASPLSPTGRGAPEAQLDLGLAGKKVVVTGGSRGIGLATALRFANEGARVALVARSAGTLDDATEQGRKANGEVSILATEIGRQGAAAEIFAAFADADILINNAGDIAGGSLEEVGPELWRQGWDTKVYRHGRSGGDRHVAPSGRRSRSHQGDSTNI